jgi:hypothetical protein
MNCFNIRELQGILKRKFFTDLVNTSDSHKSMETTLINMRHKNNMSNILLYDQSLFYNFDLTNTSKFKNYSFNPGKVYTYLGYTLSNKNKSAALLGLNYNNILTQNYNNFYQILKDIFNFVYVPKIHMLINTFNSLKYMYSALVNTFYINFSLNNLTKSVNKGDTNLTNNTNPTLHPYTQYKSTTVNYQNFNKSFSSSFSENSSS